LKFTSLEDCAFSVEVTFPEEEDFHRRRKTVENNNVSLLGSTNTKKESNENMIPSKHMTAS